MRKVIQGLNKCIEENSSAVIATIIETEGSTYQPSGVRCLIREDGRIEGLVSGGCVEQDLAERVGDIISLFKAELVFYDFRAENDLIWGMGLGCDGTVTLFLQPFDPVNHYTESMNLYNQLLSIYEANTTFSIGTIIESSNIKLLPIGMMTQLKEEELDLGSERTGFVNIELKGIMTHCFIERVLPRQHVTIFGAGPDVYPVVNQLHGINWRTTVIDHRPQYTSNRFFTNANAVVLINRSEYEDIQIAKGSYAVVMTHNYELDLMLVRKLISAETPYIGILGATRRIKNIMAELLTDGECTFHDGQIHSPIGLDLGAKSPEEIALSIIAEMLAFKNRKSAKSRIVTPQVNVYC
ncbi:hypothetical protein CVD25_10225 [Bacillus canaveralius]|uniref:XdhC/CoxI family protein n=1 Tax=Bacillus canaveralius TaxID=1403243 RepID=A0A2N5GMA2_9BACI|nr:XdhC family protein [Bacillus canaveralius]PLR82988.1 hypothetical protein CU635_10975 [Bacillus canaveralius]PLR97008.1 hypothetical protein CVD25_10225 [Bacillus canaveralius]